MLTWDEIKAEIERTLRDWQDDRIDVRLTPDAAYDGKYADLEIDVKAHGWNKPVLFTWYSRVRRKGKPPSDWRSEYADEQWEFETSEDCWADSGDLWQALFWKATDELTRARVAQRGEQC